MLPIYYNGPFYKVFLLSLSMYTCIKFMSFSVMLQFHFFSVGYLTKLLFTVYRTLLIMHNTKCEKERNIAIIIYFVAIIYIYI